MTEASVVESSDAVNVAVQVMLSEVVNVPRVPPATVRSVLEKLATASSKVMVTSEVLVPSFKEDSEKATVGVGFLVSTEMESESEFPVYQRRWNYPSVNVAVGCYLRCLM